MYNNGIYMYSLFVFQFNFAHGNVVVLTSKASGKTLRIRDGHVEGTGGKGNLG